MEMSLGLMTMHRKHHMTQGHLMGMARMEWSRMMKVVTLKCMERRETKGPSVQCGVQPTIYHVSHSIT